MRGPPRRGRGVRPFFAGGFVLHRRGGRCSLEVARGSPGLGPKEPPARERGGPASLSGISVSTFFFCAFSQLSLQGGDGKVYCARGARTDGLGPSDAPVRAAAPRAFSRPYEAHESEPR